MTPNKVDKTNPITAAGLNSNPRAEKTRTFKANEVEFEMNDTTPDQP